jgi:hypothetical protein
MTSPGPNHFLCFPSGNVENFLLITSNETLSLNQQRGTLLLIGLDGSKWHVVLGENIFPFLAASTTIFFVMCGAQITTLSSFISSQKRYSRTYWSGMYCNGVLF